jgi:hypothetical protein
MTLTVSSDVWSSEECEQQIRQTLRNIIDLDKVLKSRPVDPPHLTHTDILVREVQDLSRTLDRVQSIVNLSAQGLLSGIFLGCGGFWAFTAMPSDSIVATAAIASFFTAALWGCISFQLRRL